MSVTGARWCARFVTTDRARAARRAPRVRPQPILAQSLVHEWMAGIVQHCETYMFSRLFGYMVDQAVDLLVDAWMNTTAMREPTTVELMRLYDLLPEDHNDGVLGFLRPRLEAAVRCPVEIGTPGGVCPCQTIISTILNNAGNRLLRNLTGLWGGRCPRGGTARDRKSCRTRCSTGRGSPPASSVCSSSPASATYVRAPPRGPTTPRGVSCGTPTLHTGFARPTGGRATPEPGLRNRPDHCDALPSPVRAR